jgi:hypothetical protein
MNSNWLLINSEDGYLWRKIIRLENGYDAFIFQLTSTNVKPIGNYGYYTKHEALQNIDQIQKNAEKFKA